MFEKQIVFANKVIFKLIKINLGVNNIRRQMHLIRNLKFIKFYKAKKCRVLDNEVIVLIKFLEMIIMI
jgi:hypothetical protein